MSTLILRYIKFFFLADLLLIVLHILCGKYAILNLDRELNIPTAFATLQVFLIALVMCEIFIRERTRLRDIVPGSWIWLVLAASFAYLAIDDVAKIHERVLRNQTRDLLPPDSLWVSLMPWQIIFGPFLGIVAATLIVVMFARLSNSWRLFLPAVLALGCWVLAVLLEGLAKPLFMAHNWYNFSVVLEEGLELLGGTLFLLSFVRYSVAIKADYRPESLAGRTGYAFLKAGAVMLMVIGVGAVLVASISVRNSAWLYRHNGGVLAQRGKYDEAIVAFKQAIALEPDDVQARHALGSAYILREDYSSALRTYEEILAIDDSQWQFWHLQGFMLEKLARDQEAEDSYRRSLKLDPKHAEVWTRLGGLLHRRQARDEALKSYAMSLKINPNQPQVRRNAEKLEFEIANGAAPTGSSPTRIASGDSAIAGIDNPLTDGWVTEVFADQAHKQLKALAALLAEKRPLESADFAPLVTAEFVCTSLLPENLETVFQDSALQVQRGRSDRSPMSHAGVAGLANAVDQLLGPLQSAQDVRCKVKIFRVNQEADVVTTKQYFSCSGRVADEMVEQNATWVIRWTPSAPKELPRMQSIGVEDFEIVRTSSSTGPLFADCSEAVLQSNDCYRPQLLRGFNHWLQTSQRRRHLFRLGTPGIAVGDVNGDGLEDIYLCQEAALPNRLFLHQSDNTALDVSETWEVDWLHDSRCALFFDWDNDGDQDLAVSVLGGVLLAQNDGQQRFQFHNVLPTSDDTMSLCAADYDLDGDLDFYVCVYRRDAKISGETSSMLPGEEENFVYHDANTGGPGSLFRNDGDGGFTDVTQLVGMNSNNNRFSYAAAWEDFDNDGDVDLYVANDFGRDNLYRNDGGTFVDIAAEANVEDSASGMGVTWGDYDHDGWMDVFVSNMWSAAGNRITHQPKFKANAPTEVKKRIQRFARGNTLLKNRGDGTFEHVSSKAAVEVGRWAWGCKFFDLNNDSWDDLVVANGFITTDDPGDL